jgi:hypothetical protein
MESIMFAMKCALALVVLAVAGAAAAAPPPALPQADVCPVVAGPAQPADHADIDACWGTGSWWAKYGRQALVAAGCFVDGVGVARLLVLGATGVGGVVAGAALVLAGLACL